jgi:hypothetical protein
MLSRARAHHRRLPGWPAVLLCGTALLLVGTRAPARAQSLVEALPWPAPVAPAPAPRSVYPNPSWTRLPLRTVRGAMPSADAVAHVRMPTPVGWEDDVPLPETAPQIVCCGATPLPDQDDEPSFPIHLVAHLQAVPLPGYEAAEEGTPAFQIQLEPPGRQRLYRLESEAAFRERIRQETPRRPYEPVMFPQEPVIAEGVYERHWRGRRERVEPHYVCYKPLFFEQPNFERYGWDLGVIAPVVSTVTFYYDYLTVPYHALTSGSLCYDCSAGYCLPGDPVPLLLYPPHGPVTVEFNRSGACTH